MSDEAANRFAGTPDGGGHPEGSCGEPAPLQSRAKFLQNWDWLSVAQINGGLCERGPAQRGVNSETHTAVAEEWETRRADELSLLETFEFHKSCHRRAPFFVFQRKHVCRNWSCIDQRLVPRFALSSPQGSRVRRRAFHHRCAGSRIDDSDGE